MNVHDAVSVLRRRWYVALALLLVAGVLLAGVDKSVAKKYQATSTISLLASRQATEGTAADPGTRNPFLSYDPSLNATADFLVRRLDSPDDGLQLQGAGVTEAYSAALAASAVGPFITLTVTGANPAHVSASMNTLMTFTSKQLSTIQTQAGVPPAAMINSIVVVAPGPPSPQSKSKTQALLGVGIGGLVLVFLGTLMADNLLNGRRRRRAERAARAGAVAADRAAPESSGPEQTARPLGPDIAASAEEGDPQEADEAWSTVLAGPQESRE
ncbi:MAG TPA: hypothetical protein VGZ32_09305 [Actinocrinis sp.]|jgi:hypothetical protein|uniref:hypothetical protein n=1 Tax=Actinocrinis sp. TaxID=1920516 RepID=UPI002DDCA782|nr:hypothetical protein [Actinocrinis sp.]HEV3170525.1 hypothetical protein [Actinocrinis sp.]